MEESFLSLCSFYRSHVISPVGFLNWMFWELISQRQVLRAGCLMWGSNPFLLSGEEGGTRGFEFPPECGSSPGGWWGLWWHCVSVPPTCFHVVFFLIHPMWRSQSASLGVFLPWGSDSFYSCRFSVSVGGSEFKTFLQHHLESIYSSWAFDQPRK